jgi:hypothetical protein
MEGNRPAGSNRPFLATSDFVYNGYNFLTVFVALNRLSTWRDSLGIGKTLGRYQITSQ